MRKILVLFLSIFILSGCSLLAMDISEVKSEKHIGETVMVSGEVKGSIKIGSFSGYMLEDSTGSIGVVSNELPEEGSKVVVNGELKKSIFGYYIETK